MFDKICLFDMDGTLADYDKAMREALIKINPKNTILPSDLFNTDEYLELQMDLIKSQNNFWFNLEPIESGFEIFKMAKEIGFTNMILTKGPEKCSSAWEEKLLWCRKYCPNTGITITHAPKKQQHKGLVYGRVLVDDYPEYIEQWLQFRPRGLVIMPDRECNINFSHKQVIRYKDNKEEVLDALKKAFNR